MKLEKFWNYVLKGLPDECWPWTKAQQRYGKVGIGNPIQQWQTHRLAYTLAVGPIPEGMCVCHSCDHPICCNPAHLFLGTVEDNIADMVSKNRSSRQRGTINPAHVLTEQICMVALSFFSLAKTAALPAGLHASPPFISFRCTSVRHSTLVADA